MDNRNLLKLARARRMAKEGEAKALRLAVGLRQTEMAAISKVKSPTVSRWESGERAPSGEAGLRYAQALQRLEKLMLSEAGTPKT